MGEFNQAFIYGCSAIGAGNSGDMYNRRNESVLEMQYLQ